MCINIQPVFSNNADFELKTKQDFTALCIAAQRGHVEIVQELLDRGAEVDVQTTAGYTPLVLASGGGHLAIVKQLLLKKDAAGRLDIPTQSGYTALIEASAEGHVKVMEVLIKAGLSFRAMYAGKMNFPFDLKFWGRNTFHCHCHVGVSTKKFPSTFLLLKNKCMRRRCFAW